MLRPRIKNRTVIGLMRELDDETHTIEALLRLLDGTRYIEDICHDLSRTHPGLDPDNVRDVIADLTDAGLVEEGA